VRMASDKLNCWKLKADMTHFSYVHGIMNGEIILKNKESRTALKEFNLC
jgi:hypothetical protein